MIAYITSREWSEEIIDLDFAEDVEGKEWADLGVGGGEWDLDYWDVNYNDRNDFNFDDIPDQLQS